MLRGLRRARGVTGSEPQLYQPATLPSALRLSRRLMNNRPGWDSTFLDIAAIWAERSTCSRRKVGAVVVKDKRVIGQGYNGVAAGKTHCVDGGCPRGQLSKAECPPGSDYNAFPCYALHAEMNAILDAGLRECEGATIYVTDEPCQQCTNLIEHAKIGRVVVEPRS